jgi:hypothetical protein
MEYVGAEELLANVEVPSAHYLVENKIARHSTHVLCNASTLMPLTVLLAKRNQRLLLLVFIIHCQIKYMTNLNSSWLS